MRRRVITRARRAALCGAAILLAVATLALGARSGLTYLWCVPMQQVRSHCCCPPPTEAEQGVDRITMACCEHREVGTMPSGASFALGHVVVAAPCVGIVSLEELFAAPLLLDTVRDRSRREARAGPALRRHAQHSVFLI